MFTGRDVEVMTRGLRDVALEDAALVCDNMIAAMEQHTDAGGTITGPDFFAMEIDALREAAQIIRNKKSQPQHDLSTTEK